MLSESLYKKIVTQVRAVRVTTKAMPTLAAAESTEKPAWIWIWSGKKREACGAAEEEETRL